MENAAPAKPAGTPGITVCAPRPHPTRLTGHFSQNRTLFMCCDMQEKLADKIPGFHETIHITNNLTLFCEILGPRFCSCVATVQYPDGVGPLYHDIILPPNTPVFPKIEPSMLLPEVLPYLYGDAARGLEPVQQVVLWGHETQVCIMQTADELLRRGFRVTVVTDACAAQRRIDHEVALMEMCKWEGLLLTTSTSLYTEILRAHPYFYKPAMKLVLDRAEVFKRPYQRSEDPTLKPEEREMQLQL